MFPRRRMIVANGVDGVPWPHRALAICTMALAVSMSGLDNSIVNVALPTISRELRIAPAETVWIVSSYQIAMAMSLLPLASLGEICGYRRIYLAGLGLFTFASFAVSLSHTLAGVVAWRTVQGLGAAGILSVNIAILRFVYPRSQLGRGIGINAFIAAASATAGPPVGSLLLSFLDWHGLFAVNVPIGLVALLLAHVSVPETPRSGRSFDVVGAVAIATTIAALLFLFQGYAQGSSSTLLALEFLLFVSVGTLQLWRERDRATPLMPLDLFRIPLFRLSVLTSICSFCAQMQALVALPFLLEHATGRHDGSVGFLIAPWPAASVVAAIVAGRLSDRMSAGLLGCLGLLVLAGGLASLACLPPSPTTPDIVWRMTLCGVGFGLFQSPNNRTLISAAPPARSGSASGMLGTARMLGQSTGAALAGGMLATYGASGALRSLAIAAGVAVVAAAVSASRLLDPHVPRS